LTKNSNREGLVKGHDFSRAETATQTGRALAPAEFISDAPLEARWIVAELNSTVARVNLALENYRFDDAASLTYQFFWGSFCDWYLEIAKLRLDFSETANRSATKVALSTLVGVFETSLRLLSPFMPFITEEIWHALHDGNPQAKSIALARYPFVDESMIEESAEHEMRILQSVVSGIREARKDRGVPEKETVVAYVRGVAVYGNGSPSKVLSENRAWIEKLSRSSVAEATKQEDRLNWRSVGPTDIAIDYHAQVDIPAERERHTKDIAKYEKGLAAAERQLSNEAFIQKAPPAVVEGLKKQEAETRLLLEKARAALAALPEA
jgi:valyl-tRNA synthetase